MDPTHTDAPNAATRDTGAGDTQRPTAAPPAVPGYELDELIGRGGMGDVYRARDLELDREVAVKILQEHYPADSPTAARFLEEAKITGQLQHPGVPAVYRVAALPDGRPFLAMKLIKGCTLDTLLKAGSAVNHLAIMEAVAQAVGYAHAHGVVHRDLKPQNVMVGAFGEVQVMDWGLAKVLVSRAAQPSAVADPEATTAQTVIRTGRDSDFTQAGSVLGTPAYMPPEQAAGETGRVGPASDVFGLGALWCKLLTGEPPFGGAEVEAVRRKALRGKTEEALARLDGCGAEPEAVALCQRCLAVEPEDRPADANAVAQAVAALRVAAEERARQAELSRARAEVEAAEQAKRRRVVQRAAAAVAAVLLLGVAGTGLGLWREAEQRQQAEAESALANAVKEFLQYDVLLLADPAAQQREGAALNYDADVRLRDVVLRAAEKIEGKFQDRPLVEAEIRNTLGYTLRGMGRPDLAAKQFERVREVRRGHLGSDHPDTLLSMSCLAVSYADLGRHLDALKLREETLALMKTRLGHDHRDTLLSMNNLAGSYADLGRHADAIKLHEETLALRKAKLGPDDPDTLHSMNDLARSYAALGRHADALKLCEETLALRKAKLGPDHPDTLQSMNSLARSYAALGRHADALKLCEETLALRKAKLGPNHPDTLHSMNNLAYSYTDMGRHADALKLHEETLTLMTAKLGDDHPETLMSMNNLAVSYAQMGRQADALKLHEATLALRKAKLEPDHPDTLRSMANLANSYYTLGRHAEALKLREETITLRNAKLGADHPDTLNSEWGVIASLVALNRPADALPRIDALLARADSAAAAGKRLNPQLVPTMLSLRMQIHRAARDAAGCRATAKMWEQRGPKVADEMYDAACHRAVAAAVQARAKGDESARLAQADADRAIAWLTKAVAAGFTNRAHMEKDTDLDFLRSRADFQKLLAGLPQAKAATK
jgi:tetratricopeptide (TPR) repeat protein